MDFTGLATIETVRLLHDILSPTTADSFDPMQAK